MNILLITHFCVGFMVSEIPRVSVFGHCPYSVTFPYNLRIRDHSSTYSYRHLPPWFPFNKRSTYIILSINN